MPHQDAELDETFRSREQHIEKLKKRVSRLCGGEDGVFISPDCPQEIASNFLENVLAFEEAEERPLFDVLIEDGFSLPAPKDLCDQEIREKLWEVIYAMSRRGYFLYHTDHLSDRELYLRLWEDTLKEPTAIIPEKSLTSCHIDLVGDGSSEQMEVYLKYYADVDERRWHGEEFPEDEIPTHRDPPYDRDRHLPQPSVGGGLVSGKADGSAT